MNVAKGNQAVEEAKLHNNQTDHSGRNALRHLVCQKYSVTISSHAKQTSGCGTVACLTRLSSLLDINDTTYVM